MEYYIVTDISENYNNISNLACNCKMEIIDYLKYSIIKSFNVDIQNIKVINNNIKNGIHAQISISSQQSWNAKNKKNNIVYDIISNNYDSIKDFVYQYFGDEDHYNLIHKITIK